MPPIWTTGHDPVNVPSPKNKILVSGPVIEETLLSPLRRLGCTVAAFSHPLTTAALREELKDCVAYIHGGEEHASAEALELAEYLRVIAFLGIGYETFIDVTAAREAGVLVTNTPDRTPDAVAEFTVGQIINANRRIPQHLGTFYPHWSDDEQLPNELVTRRVGIVGLGSIGTRVAKILSRGFGCEVSYYSQTRKPREEELLHLRFRELPDLAERSDILVIMVPGNRDTRNMINKEVLDRLPPGAILVNTARASVVEPVALGDALRTGKLSSAVFDGHYRDSEFSKRLLDEFGDRFLATGHIASHTRQSVERMVRQAVRSIVNILTTGTDSNIVVGPQT